MTRIAVTGANGFIGGYLTDALLADGHQVLCVGRSAQSLSAVSGDVERHVTDFSVDDLVPALAGCTALVHLAGRRSVRGEDMEFAAEFAHTGLTLLDSLLRAAHENGIGQVVQASSIAVYSQANAKPFSESDTPVPINNYGLGKWYCEQYGDWIAKRRAMNVAHLRIAACYGAGERLTPALMKMSDLARRAQHITLSNGGHYSIDQIYVADVVDAIGKVLAKGATGPYNIGSGGTVSIREIAETANEVFDNVGNLTIEAAEPGANNPTDNFMSIERARDVLGWEPQYPLARGLQSMRDNWIEQTN